MAISADGFLRPQQMAPITVETDRLVAETCPGIRLNQTSREGGDHPLWGPMVSVLVGSSTDAALRHHASSGGALSAILLHLLDSGVVDYVLQTAASDTFPLDNLTVASRNRTEIYQAAGSRYSPSAPLSDVVRCLEQPGRFALVGKPCDIAGARSLALHDRRVGKKIPVMISCFCAGVPSIIGTRTILQLLEIDEAEVAQFRYRGNGWPGKATATLRNGREYSMSYVESWGNILSRHVQHRCKICPDGSGGFADIVCGDAWHSDDKGYPIFGEGEEEGRSLIVTRTSIGERHVRAAIAAGCLDTEALSISDIEAMQPYQARRKRLVLSRLLAMAAIGWHIPRFRGLNLLRAAVSESVFGQIRSFAGMMKRLVTRR